jgi:integrase
MTGRTAAYGRAAFAWAVKRGMVQTNPFADLPVSTASAKRERLLSDDEIAEIWRAAGGTRSPFGTIVRFLILTGQRRGEVAGMAWCEISDDLASWTMPGERTKNGAVHMVPGTPSLQQWPSRATPPSSARHGRRSRSAAAIHARCGATRPRHHAGDRSGGEGSGEEATAHWVEARQRTAPFRQIAGTGERRCPR